MKTSTMKRSEVPEVSRLLGSSYRALGRKEGLSADQTHYLCAERGSEATVGLESRSQQYLVVREGDRIIGMVAVAGEKIAKLYVSPDRTGRGVGRALYEAAESLIRAHGLSHVRLGAFPTAVSFYERMGMSIVGESAATGPLAGRKMTLMEKELGSDPA